MTNEEETRLRQLIAEGCKDALGDFVVSMVPAIRAELERYLANRPAVEESPLTNKS